jgi:hypothetical protein
MYADLALVHPPDLRYFYSVFCPRLIWKVGIDIHVGDMIMGGIGNKACYDYTVVCVYSSFTVCDYFCIFHRIRCLVSPSFHYFWNGMGIWCCFFHLISLGVALWAWEMRVGAWMERSSADSPRALFRRYTAWLIQMERKDQVPLHLSSLGTVIALGASFSYDANKIQSVFLGCA